jgi:uncharacterized protein
MLQADFGLGAVRGCGIGTCGSTWVSMKTGDRLQAPRTQPFFMRPFHVMAKPAGASCNLACRYCFYLEKDALYPGPGAHKMTDAVLEAYVRDYIAAHPADAEVGFAWQGGEPTLMGLDFFRRAVALQQRHAGGRRIANALQTNGVLLDDAWGEFLHAHRFLIGLSLDGPQPQHDAYRVDRGGRPTFDRVMAGLAILKKHGVEFNTLTVINRANSQKPLQVYRFLREVGSGFMQFIPLVERTAGPAETALGLTLAAPPDSATRGDWKDAAHMLTLWSVRPADFGEFLCIVFDEWVRRDVGRVFVQLFDSTLAAWVGQGAGVCVFSEECGRAVVLEHNGDLYACDHYVYARHRLGNLLETNLRTMVDSPGQQEFGEAKRTTLPRQCRECAVLFACNGECPKHRFVHTSDGEPGLNYLCEAYKRFFHHVDPAMTTMAGLLAAGRAPAEIMHIPHSKWTHGRL